ncbi:MAG: NAD-dependent epimerase/dehydratase family protein [Candidatus Aminicenantaceae bacterium]
MKSLVTGASGYIGGNLIRKMAEKGMEVKAFVRKTSDIRKLKELNNIEICYGDLTDFSSLEKAVMGSQVVFHVAAASSDWGDYKNFFHSNYVGTKNILRASIKAHVKKFIYISTIGVLDLRRKGIIQESHPYGNFPGSYRRSKTEAEKLVRKHSDVIPTVIIRPPPVYGPEDPQCTSRTLRFARKNPMFLVKGGRGIFPHVYIDNLIDSILLAAQKKEAEGEIFNVTDDVSTTAKEFFTHLNHIAGKGDIHLSLAHPVAWVVALLMDLLARLNSKPPVLSWTALDFLVLKSRFDISNARDKLDYKPAVSLDEGMRRVKLWWESITAK